jgi:hypothetical protein
MNFILTSAKKETSKRGGAYWVGTYDVEYLDKESGQIKKNERRINSAVELLPEWVGKKIFVTVNVDRRWDPEWKREFENYFITEAALATRPV